MASITALLRDRLAQERGTITKDWGGKISVALIYPNHYQVAMSNLGFQAVYGILNDNPDIVSERAFLPEQDELALYKRADQALLSLESLRPLRAFDLLAFSVSFENDYPNILTILELAKIPLMSKDRVEDIPLVLAGGVATFMNPEPLAGFIDCFLLGEGEAIVNQFFESYRDLDLSTMTRHEALAILAEKVEGVYCPSLYEVAYNDDGTIRSFAPSDPSIPSTVKAAQHIPFDGSPCTSRITTPITEFSDARLVELSRGCGYACRFCAAGYVYRPPRTRREDELVQSFENLLAEPTRFGLMAPCVSDVPGIEALTGHILDTGSDFSLSSLRANSLTPGLVKNLKRSTQKTLTIAPETGSERLRRVINKKLTDKDIIDAVILVARTGFFHLKLYFMIGLPTETREDVKAIVTLVKKMRHHLVKESKGRKRIGRIRISVSCFVPKPFTPFQWFPMDDMESLKEKQKLLKGALSREGGIAITFDVPKWAYLQTLLSLGDRRVGNMLLTAHENGGNWKRTFRSSELNPDFFVYRHRDPNETLPWDFIGHGINKSFLQEEYNLALQEKESPACSVGTCTRCGVCT